MALILALAAACSVLVLVLMRLGRWADLTASVNKGVFDFVLRTLNTASEATTVW